MQKTVHFETLGCKLNQIESESACKVFSDCGWNVSVKTLTFENSLTDEEIQDTLLCVVNTCTVTAKAEQKCRRVIKLLLKVFPNACVIVTGCYAQVEEKFISKMNERIAVLPGTKKDYLADLPAILQKEDWFENLKRGKENPLDCKESCTECGEAPGKKTAAFLRSLFLKAENFQATDHFRLSTDTFFSHSRSSIKIQDGCGNSCSFCRIHIARGKPVSLNAEVVLERVRQLEKAGHGEVILTGVNLSQYRSTIPNRDGKGDFTGGFADLLEYVSENTESIFFRISSLYPESIDEKFCSVLQKSRVRPHFHLSVQSGSDSVLKAMNRPYKSCQVLKAVNLLRGIYEDPFIACDIITGFPGETDEDFEKTMELCRECNFTWIHAFPFSPRPGTAAFTMKNQVANCISGRRLKKLTSLAENNKKNYVLNNIGKSVKAIVEKRQDTLVRCVTENFLHAHLQLPQNIGSAELSGKEITVKISGVSDLPECECECVVIKI